MIELGKSFGQKLKGRVQAYRFEVGILQDDSYKKPKVGKRGLHGDDVKATYAGGPVRKKSSIDSGKTISDVSKANRDRIGKNYLVEPFKRKSSDIIRFTEAFFKVIGGSTQVKRLENLLQAIVRNPILRGEWGSNSDITKKIKGFDRPMIDTGQLFKAITAKVVKRV